MLRKMYKGLIESRQYILQLRREMVAHVEAMHASTDRIEQFRNVLSSTERTIRQANESDLRQVNMVAAMVLHAFPELEARIAERPS
jgi:hypothetical protein